VYFPHIIMKINFDVPNRNEMSTKDYSDTFKHHVYVEFSFGNYLFDCGFDYLEKSNIIDNWKNISSLVNLDYYKYFDADCDKTENFIQDITYRLLIIVCCVSGDEYKLAEIIFIKSHRNLPNLQNQIDIFSRVINAKKTNLFNILDWFYEIMPVNTTTELDMEFDEFIQYINSNVFTTQTINVIDGQYISWEDFEIIIMELSTDISLQLANYKKIFTQGIGTLIESLKTINELTMQINKTKKYIPQYIDHYVENILVHSDKNMLKNTNVKLTNYFAELEEKQKQEEKQEDKQNNKKKSAKLNK
jgi:hypothetical protein